MARCWHRRRFHEPRKNCYLRCRQLAPGLEFSDSRAAVAAAGRHAKRQSENKFKPRSNNSFEARGTYVKVPSNRIQQNWRYLRPRIDAKFAKFADCPFGNRDVAAGNAWAQMSFSRVSWHFQKSLHDDHQYFRHSRAARHLPVIGGGGLGHSNDFSSPQSSPDNSSPAALRQRLSGCYQLM